MTAYQYNQQTMHMIAALEQLGYRVWHDGKEWHASGKRELVSPFLSELVKAVKG